MKANVFLQEYVDKIENNKIDLKTYRSRNSNISVTGNIIRSYGTLIAVYKNGVIYITKKKYSTTTSRHCGIVRGINCRIPKMDVDEDMFQQILNN